jgi:sugar phosphate isomerase/epimerase
MELRFGKSKWEMWDDPLEAFLRRAKDDGFDATEIWLATLSEEAEQVADLHDAYGLGLIGQILTRGDTYRDHIASLEQQLDYARRCRPLFVNTHAGRDVFPFEENVRIFERLLALSRESSLAILVETHRGRALYSAVETRRYLEALPELRLTADFSHWMVVHESNLADQEANVRLAVERSSYVHGRVGYEEGPQVPHPLAPEWRGHVENHLRLWQRILDHHRTAGADAFYVTPEFGPPNYMHTLPFTHQPVADTWRTNVAMRDLLREELRP